MDPLTHMLTGACISRTGLNRKTALATAVLVLSAEASDFDILLYARGSVFGFAHHRGFTHTLIGVPFVAAGVLLFLYVLRRVRAWLRQRVEPPSAGCPACPPVDLPAYRRTRWGLLYVYGLIGGLSHILLDFTNAYGVRPFEPISYKWYSWDIVSLVEPVILVALLGGLILPGLFGLISEEIGARKRGPRGRGGAIAALVIVVLTWGVRDFEHRRALAAMDALDYNQQEPIREGAYPYAFNPFIWHGVVETRGFFETFRVDSLTPQVDPEGRAQIRYKPEETPVTLAAKKSYLGRVYLDWASFPVTETEQTENGYTVRFLDLRYMYPERRTRPLSAVCYLDDKLRVVDEWMGLREATRQRMH